MPETDYLELVDRLARIETKVDTLTDDNTADDQRYRRVSDRVARIERFMWLAIGLSIASGAPDAARLFITSVR